MTINIIFCSENGGKQFVALLHVALFLQEMTANSGTDHCYITQIPYYL